MATTPQPSSGNAAEGWTLKQIAQAIHLTASSREVVELAQRLATMGGAARTEPVQVLGAILQLPRNPAHQALVALNVNLESLQNASDSGRAATTVPSTPAPIGPSTRYLLINAHREAQQMGHYRVDAVHLLLALLYKDSPATAQRLEAAGLTIFAIRLARWSSAGWASGPGPPPV